MRYITYEDLLGYNKFVCELEGAESVVINEDNLLSALSVQSSYYDTDELIASALFRSLIIAHGFQDGNKRTATICLLDIYPPAVPDTVIEDVAIQIATGQLVDVSEIANILF